MAIAFNQSFGTSESGSANSLSLTNKTCAGSDRLLLVAISHGIWNGGSTVSSLTYAGGSLTQLGPYFSYNGDGRRLSLWYLIAPSTSANQTLSVSFSGTSYCSLTAVQYTGVDQTSPFTTPQTMDDSASPGSVSCTSD